MDRPADAGIEREAALHRGGEAVDLDGVPADARAAHERGGDLRVRALDGLLLRPARVVAERLRGGLQRGELGGDGRQPRALGGHGGLPVRHARRGLAIERHQLADDRGSCRRPTRAPRARGRRPWPRAAAPASTASACDGGIVRIVLPARSRTSMIMRPLAESLLKCSSRFSVQSWCARSAAAPISSSTVGRRRGGDRDLGRVRVALGTRERDREVGARGRSGAPRGRPGLDGRQGADLEAHLGLGFRPLRARALNGLDVYPTAENSSASSDSCCLSVRLSCEWIWQTRLSDTPRMSPISRSVRFLT